LGGGREGEGEGEMMRCRRRRRRREERMITARCDPQTLPTPLSPFLSFLLTYRSQ